MYVAYLVEIASSPAGKRYQRLARLTVYWYVVGDQQLHDFARPGLDLPGLNAAHTGLRAAKFLGNSVHGQRPGVVEFAQLTAKATGPRSCRREP